jgi:hypothetical protein
MRPGDVVELRSIYRGSPRWGFPTTVVEDDGLRLALYLAPGAKGYWIPTEGRYLERWARGDDPDLHEWKWHHVLWLIRRGDAHMLGHFWDESWAFKGWYVNLQLPVTERDGFVDTMDQALDVVVDPDGTWRWKDAADLAECVALGIFTEAEASTVRAEGERVIAARPWPTGWEDWRPWPSRT